MSIASALASVGASVVLVLKLYCWSLCSVGVKIVLLEQWISEILVRTFHIYRKLV